MITVAIISILATISAPSMSESIQNSKTKELSREFTAALHLTKSEAIKRGIQVSMSPKQNNSNEWQTGWNVFADPNGNGVQDSGEELLQSYDMTSDTLTLTSKDSIFATWLGFLPSGGSKGSAGIGGGFRICRSNNDTTTSRKITIQASGNIIIEAGTLSCP